MTSEVDVLLRAWRSLGLRAAGLEWDLDGESSLRPPLAARLRSALGPVLREADADVFAEVFDAGPAPLWFVGWDPPAAGSQRVAAELCCLGVLERRWDPLARALSGMRLPGPSGLVSAKWLRMRWAGQESGSHFGPPLGEVPELPMSGGDCLIEAIAPLQVVERGRVVLAAPTAEVLVRSAGERLRQLCARWGNAEGLSGVIGLAVREARAARLQWSRAAVARQRRLSSRTGGEQWIVGVRGEFAYADMPGLGLALLALATEIGLGKDTAFGCGAIRLALPVRRGGFVESRRQLPYTPGEVRD